MIKQNTISLNIESVQKILLKYIFLFIIFSYLSSYAKTFIPATVGSVLEISTNVNVLVTSLSTIIIFPEIFNAISSDNEDSLNKFFLPSIIKKFPNNNVRIFNNKIYNLTIISQT